jgi:hypothetical protein
MWYGPTWVLTAASVRSGLLAERTEIGLLHHGRRDHLGGLAVRNQPAVVQHDDAIGERAHDIHLVLDQENGAVACAFDRLNEIEDNRDLVDAHAGRRLVEHEDFRPQCQHDCDFELALVAVRERACGGVRLRRQIHLPQQVVGLRDQIAVLVPQAQEVEADARPALHRDPHVLVHAEIGKQIGQLEGAADAAAPARRDGLASDVLVVPQHLPGGRLQLAGHEVKVGGLAGAVGADDGGERAGLEGATHRVDGDVAAEVDGEIARFQDRHRQPSGSGRRRAAPSPSACCGSAPAVRRSGSRGRDRGGRSRPSRSP